MYQTYNVIDEEEKLLVKLHYESTRKGQHLLSLRAYEVLDFSSQYGTEDSLSYTADNLLGPPAIYPRFGDHAYSYQLRTYGKWSERLPSYHNVPPVNLPSTCLAESQDFVEFKVEKRVVPILLRIYEIYNPGAIVKIFSYCYDTEKWVTVWQGKPQYMDPIKANCFSVSFKDINFYSDYFRIEFHHRHLDYFCEFDGVVLYGEDKFPLHFPSYNLSSLSKVCFRGIMKNHTDIKIEEDSNPEIPCYFDLLPEEVITIIMSFLDLRSLCIVASVSKMFKKCCYEPVLYKMLNLQIYWHLVDMLTLNSLQPRLKSITHLNLSWCGGQDRITPAYFKRFLTVSCTNLSVLKISNCPFLTNSCMKAIATCCQNLEVLEMRCCRSLDLTRVGFLFIADLPKLKYLDLYRTLVDSVCVLLITKQCPNLEHLLLGSCANIRTCDEVARSIAKCLKNIKTLDLWRATSLTSVGVYALAEDCHNLVELDLGWCYRIDANCGCLKELISRNRKLKKLFLTAIRTVSNEEIDTIADYCRDLEQLDILGTSEVDLHSVEKVLESCKKLQLLDVSYCDNSVKMAVPTLQEKYSSVEIKCSVFPEVNY